MSKKRKKTKCRFTTNTYIGQSSKKTIDRRWISAAAPVIQAEIEEGYNNYERSVCTVRGSPSQ